MTGIIAQNVGRTSGLIKAASGSGEGAWTKIKEITASADSTIDFIDGTDDVVLDSTYPIYVFKYYNIHPSVNYGNLQFQVSVDGGSSYGIAKTSTSFYAGHYEDDTNADVVYLESKDLAQGTGAQLLSNDPGNGNDESCNGTLHLYDPNSTIFVKHFIARTLTYNGSDICIDGYFAGYINSTSAVNAVQFSASSGNIDAGTIKLYGIKDS